MNDDYMDDLEELEELEEIGEWEQLAERLYRRIRKDPFNDLSDEEFVHHYKFPKACFCDILQRIQALLPDSRTRRGLRIPPQLQLLVALGYMTSGNFQSRVCDSTGMSQSSVSRCVYLVTDAIASLAPDLIRFPEPGNEEESMQQFVKVAGMPRVIGCVGGAHIPIRRTGGGDAKLYKCRDNVYSINVMGVCDSELKFTNLIVNWPGSTPDIRIFSESRLAERLETGRYQGFLLGDNGYACLPYLMTPFVDPATDQESSFNASHGKTRSLIEQTFDLLKRRFGVLSKRPIGTKFKNIKSIILACAVLHNIAVMHQLPLGESGDVEVLVPDAPRDSTAHDTPEALNIRANIVKDFF
ncbi:putative nuclease HARBI1 [Chionoecetes opilio]|uniref:Putative nuclease HARBI1 n=1 Tax=Chionoecetes opilio TaxID=41210 RepID=A0A8J4XR93_CHIOP|nr:putative nuclease HARBI1 [Chionoecetes opilio]